MNFRLTLVLIFFCCSVIGATGQKSKPTFTKQDSLFVFNANIDLKLRQRMLDSSFANNSTAPNFVVIKALNKLTGQSKEVCTEAPFVMGGVDQNIGQAKSQKYNSRSFCFNTKAALDNIGFDEYTYKDLIVYGRQKKIRDIVNSLLKNGIELDYNFQGTRKEQFMFAHILFNNGIMSTRGCIAGNFMTLKKI